MPWVRLIRWVGALLVLLLVLAVVLTGTLWLYFHPNFTQGPLVTYGQRHSEPLYLDVIRPETTNGLGVVLMVSGRRRTPCIPGGGEGRPSRVGANWCPRPRSWKSSKT